MYLHEDKTLFEKIINITHISTGIVPSIIEKDYYVTMILRLITEKSISLGEIVFKGGTSLSKCHKVIDRFSEDIDITFTEHIGDKRRKKLKYNVMKSLSEELKLTIKNWDFLQSDRDLNSYFFDYSSLFKSSNIYLRDGVKVETALASYSFPTDKMTISSYIGDYLIREDKHLAEQYSLTPFEMNVQSLSRTFIDKVYATCDYYIQKKSRRLSRHIYDLHKIFPKITFNDDFIKLVHEVKAHRATMNICPSAKSGANISKLILNYCDENFYKSDFDIITDTLINEEISYSDVIGTMRKIASFNFW
ncbi:nucleotidyl transferase AbiEii/AbiGii toxin family protein [Treponema sp.]|uniref:nucleotidyl transferase AbiEii/AbiGii toxin family protein n=1 Tax=Treponema sp. TaxID=166 RepID=UPI00388FB265